MSTRAVWVCQPILPLGSNLGVLSRLMRWDCQSKLGVRPSDFHASRGYGKLPIDACFLALAPRSVAPAHAPARQPGAVMENSTSDISNIALLLSKLPQDGLAWRLVSALADQPGDPGVRQAHDALMSVKTSYMKAQENGSAEDA